MPRPSISGHPLSSKALAWVKSQLALCTSKHTSCRDFQSPQFPKRVLFLNHTVEGNVNVKLVEDHKQYVPYIALSHCWGKEQTCITTSRTLERYKSNIPWLSIPRTFQDAMIFALKLEVQYVWVDSLCIIQDDPSDWDIESSKMADVYQNSYLTLAATASTSDSQGCYPEQPSIADMSEVHIPQICVDSYQIAVRKSLRHWHAVSQNIFKMEYPLLSRAWVFQERLLSPRLLHSCISELIWKCRQGTTCECGNLAGDLSLGGEYYQIFTANERALLAYYSSRLDEVKRALEEKKSPVPFHGLRAIARLERLHEATQKRLERPLYAQQHFETISMLPEGEIESAGLSRQYRKLVERYSALEFSKSTDRLPALSCLCERVKHLRGVYLAGIWADSIWFDLLWRVNAIQYTPEHCRMFLNGRPTWSWISVQSPVRYWDDLKSLPPRSHPSSYVREADVLKIHIGADLRHNERRPLRYSHQIKLAGKNPYGEVSSAILKVTSYYWITSLRYVYESQTPTTNLGDVPLRYEINIRGTAIPIFADYVLAEEGPRKIKDRSLVILLLFHPQVALVLVQDESAPNASQDWKPSFKRSLESLPGSKSIRENHENERVSTDHWERIGIVRVPDTLLSQYRIDWMRGAAISRFSIV